MLDNKVGSKRPEYLIYPLFVQNNANVIYADRSSAKSLFMMLITLMLQLNCDAYNLKTNGSRVILWLDWENDAKTTGWQKECLLKGLGLEDVEVDVAYLHLSRPLVNSIPQIQKKIEEVKADVIVIDSLGVAVGEDLNKSEPAIIFFNALRQLPVTPLIIAHTAKDKNNTHKTVYGNAFYENLARSIWEATKIQEPGANELKFSLYQRKSPPFSGYQKPLGFKFMFDGDKTYVDICEPAPDDRDSEPKNGK